MRKIAAVTGTRAEFGLLKPLLDALDKSRESELSLIVTGAHLSPQFGETISEIEESGLSIKARVDIEIDGGDSTSIIRSVALGLNGFAEAFTKLNPDLVVVLGDRYEILAVVQTAMLMGIPVAHIHGGEITMGAFDDSIRHAITKMSNIHLTAANEFRDRVIQMGEQPRYVHMTGALGVDALLQAEKLSRRELEATMNGFSFGDTNFLVTHHPVTREKDNGLAEIEALILALNSFPQVKLIITYPNSDTGGDLFAQKLRELSLKEPARVYLTSSLGHKRYISCLEQVDVVIGNSSSGIIEVPYFKTPTVNIGDRQKGRLQGESVINVVANVTEIVNGIKQALNPAFTDKLSASNEYLYGDGNSVSQIKDILETTDLTGITKKHFFDTSIQENKV